MRRIRRRESRAEFKDEKCLTLCAHNVNVVGTRESIHTKAGKRIAVKDVLCQYAVCCLIANLGKFTHNGLAFSFKFHTVLVDFVDCCPDGFRIERKINFDQSSITLRMSTVLTFRLSEIRTTR